MNDDRINKALDAVADIEVQWPRDKICAVHFSQGREVEFVPVVALCAAIRAALQSSRQPQPQAKPALENVADAEIKALFVEWHGTDKGWLGVEGSYFISGVSAARKQPQAQHGGDEDWHGDCLAATSHLDYETEASEPVKVALRQLRAALATKEQRNV